MSPTETEIEEPFLEPVRTPGGHLVKATLRGRPRADGTWEAWLEFLPDDQTALHTSIETTQPNRQAVLSWASGLTPSYFEGAFDRAKRVTLPDPPRKPVPQIVTTHKSRVLALESWVLSQFRERRATQLLATHFFANAGSHANADVVRAFEALEKRRLIRRLTADGENWIALTELGRESIANPR